MSEIAIAVVEDSPRYREGLEELIAHSSGLRLAASYSSAEGMLAAVAAGAQWDVALVDLGLPRMSGIEAIRKLKEARPGVRAVVVTVFEDPARIVEAIGAGADGYVFKSTPAVRLVAQLRAVATDGAHLTGGVAQAVLNFVRESKPGSPAVNFRLTEREQGVLRGLVDGLTYQQIADRIGISLDTVRTHLRAVYGKLRVRNAAAAVARAIRERIV